MKKILIVFPLIVVLLFSGCRELDNKDEGTNSTPTPAIRTEVPSTDEPTPEPTEAPTPEPVATVEPGKETYAEGIKDENKGVRYTFRPSTGEANHIMIQESLSTQFFATTTFNKLEVECPSYSDDIGTIVMELYPWMGSYDLTLDKENNPPIVTKEFVNYPDNALLAIELEEALLDGEYLLHLTTPDPSEQVGVWANYDAEDLVCRTYIDGVEKEGCGFGPIVYYTKTPNKLYGPITG
jgi:hypothetical protein